MYRKSYISAHYKNYISKFFCIFCGDYPVDIHHESVTAEFSGSMKKRNDFTAVPVCHSCHLGGIHTHGNDFWVSHKRNPIRVVKKLIKHYKSSLSFNMFETEEEYLDNLAMANDTLEVIAIRPHHAWVE
jgi:hypothetical protein